MSSTDSARIYSYTIIRSATAQFADRVPYCVAVLELPDGSHVSALVEGFTDGMAIQIGQPVRTIPDSDAPGVSFAF